MRIGKFIRKPRRWARFIGAREQVITIDAWNDALWYTWDGFKWYRLGLLEWLVFETEMQAVKLPDEEPPFKLEFR